MMKMDKHSSLVSGIEKRLSMISDLPAQNDMSANTIGDIQIWWTEQLKPWAIVSIKFA